MTPRTDADRTTGLALPRWALGVYWPTLALGTHWPNLQFPEFAHVVTDLDKILHAVAFAILTFLLIHALRRTTHARRNAIYAAGIAAAYAAIDEYTQRYVARFPSMADLTANLFGVCTVGLVYWTHLNHRYLPVRWVRPARIVLALALPAFAVGAFIPIEYPKRVVNAYPVLRQMFYTDFDKHLHLACAMLLTWLIPAARLFGSHRPLRNTLWPIALLVIAGPMLEAFQRIVGRRLNARDMAYHEYGLVIGLIVWLAFIYARDTLGHTRRPANPNPKTP